MTGEEVVEKFATMEKIARETETFVVLHFSEAVPLLKYIRTLEAQVALYRSAENHR